MRRAAEVLASVRALGAFNPASEDRTFARARTLQCRATYVHLPDGSWVEIHDDLDGSYAAFRSTNDGAFHALDDHLAAEILTILAAAGFPVAA